MVSGFVYLLLNFMGCGWVRAEGGYLGSSSS